MDRRAMGLRASSCGFRTGTGRAPLPAVLLSWLLLAWLLLGLARSSAAAKPPKSRTATSPITSIESVRRLSLQQAAMAHPGRIRAMVTYYDPDWRGLFVQQGKVGIYVALGQTYPAHLAPGTQIELLGTTDGGGFAPILREAQIQVVGKGALPKGEMVSLERRLSGREDARWVPLRGGVHKARADVRRFFVDVYWEGRRIQLKVAIYANGRLPDRFSDSEIVGRGVCGSDFNAQRQLTGAYLWVPDLSQIAVRRPGAELTYARADLPVGAILRYDASEEAGHLVRVRGTVTAAGEGSELYIQDDSGSLTVRSADIAGLRPGDRIEVAGFPDNSTLTPSLVDAT